jgi:CheY-like chemotaxis protein
MTTVLIVEDEPSNFRVMAKFLTKGGGLEVKGSENVVEILTIARHREVDIILMDVGLKHSYYQGKAVDGVQITQMLKSDPQTATIPIILVTAYAMRGDQENLLKQSGADGYVTKPIEDYYQLIEKIKQLTTTNNSDNF